MPSHHGQLGPPLSLSERLEQLNDNLHFMGERLTGAWNWLCQKVNQTATQVEKGLSLAWSTCLEKLKNGCAALSKSCWNLARQPFRRWER